MTALFSEPDGSFTSAGSLVDHMEGAVKLRLVAVQSGCSTSPRSTTGIDISFDNLLIEADVIGLPCIADIDLDRLVATSDLLLVLAQWGPCPPQCVADANGDGHIDLVTGWDWSYVITSPSIGIRIVGGNSSPGKYYQTADLAISEAYAGAETGGDWYRM